MQAKPKKATYKETKEINLDNEFKELKDEIATQNREMKQYLFNLKKEVDTANTMRKDAEEEMARLREELEKQRRDNLMMEEKYSKILEKNAPHNNLHIPYHQLNPNKREFNRDVKLEGSSLMVKNEEDQLAIKMKRKFDNRVPLEDDALQAESRFVPFEQEPTANFNKGMFETTELFKRIDAVKGYDDEDKEPERQFYAEKPVKRLEEGVLKGQGHYDGVQKVVAREESFKGYDGDVRMILRKFKEEDFFKSQSSFKSKEINVVDEDPYAELRNHKKMIKEKESGFIDGLLEGRMELPKKEKKVEKFRESLQKTKDSFYKLSQAEGSQNYNKEYEELKNEIRQLDDMMLRLNGFKV